MRVQPSHVAAPDRHSVAIEEVQDLDRDLAPVVDPISELTGRKHPFGSSAREIPDDPGHFGHRGAGEEMIRRDLVDAAGSAGEFADAAHFGLGFAGQAGEIAHPGWPKAIDGVGEMGRNAAPERFVGRAEPGFVTREPHPGSLGDGLPGRDDARQRREEDGARQARFEG